VVLLKILGSAHPLGVVELNATLPSTNTNKISDSVKNFLSCGNSNSCTWFSQVFGIL